MRKQYFISIHFRMDVIKYVSYIIYVYFLRMLLNMFHIIYMYFLGVIFYARIQIYFTLKVIIIHESWLTIHIYNKTKIKL